MIRLSNRGYPGLRWFAKNGPDTYMSIEEAQRFDQRPLRSMQVRGDTSSVPRRGFRITRAGRDAWTQFLESEILGKNSYVPLTNYFDLITYSLRPCQSAAVHELKAAW
jgi:hypothetical protein